VITFAAGRGGRVGGKPNNNCAADRLIAATGGFGRTARVPMLWIYIENDTFFRSGIIEENAPSLHRGRRQRRVSPVAAVRQRWPFPDQFARLDPVMGTLGGSLPRQARLRPAPYRETEHGPT
jgi:hypothetical protein